MAWWVWILIVAGYALGIGLTAGLWATLASDNHWDGTGGAVAILFGGVLWPIGLPIAVGLFLTF